MCALSNRTNLVQQQVAQVTCSLAVLCLVYLVRVQMSHLCGRLAMRPEIPLQVIGANIRLSPTT